MKALICGVLTQYGPPRHTRLIAALPIAMAKGDDGDQVKAEVKHALLGTHTWMVAETKHTLAIDEVIVTSQVSGAMFDFILNNQGAMPPERNPKRDDRRRPRGFALCGGGGESGLLDFLTDIAVDAPQIDHEHGARDHLSHAAASAHGELSIGKGPFERSHGRFDRGAWVTGFGAGCAGHTPPLGKIEVGLIDVQTAAGAG